MSDQKEPISISVSYQRFGIILVPNSEDNAFDNATACKIGNIISLSAQLEKADAEIARLRSENTKLRAYKVIYGSFLVGVTSLFAMFLRSSK